MMMFEDDLARIFNLAKGVNSFSFLQYLLNSNSKNHANIVVCFVSRKFDLLFPFPLLISAIRAKQD